MNASKPAGLFRTWREAVTAIAVWLALAAIVVVPLLWLVLSGAAL